MSADLPGGARGADPFTAAAVVALQSGGGGLQLLFVVGSLIFLLAIWLVLRHPIDLSDDAEAPPDASEEKPGPAASPAPEHDDDPPGSDPKHRRAA